MVGDGLFTVGPGVGSFEAALLADAFGNRAAELAQFIIGYDPHPPFGSRLASSASRNLRLSSVG